MGSATIGLVWLVMLVAGQARAGPYFDDLPDQRPPPISLSLAEDEALGSDADYPDNAIENLLHAVQQKRACVRRNGNCDHRPHECCFSSSCRCNLWGSNCRCQRVGLFQKWG